VAPLDVDFTGPSVAITTPLAEDNVINAAEQGDDLVVSGTSSVSAGEAVTVTFNGVDYDSAPVAGGTWSVTIPAADLAALVHDTDYAVTANVTDFEGIAAPEVSVTLRTDFVAPELSIDTPIAGDNVINIAEAGADLSLSGDASGAEDGQVVTVTTDFNGVEYTATVAGGAWSLTIPAADLAGLPGPLGAAGFTATVSDAAKNAATPADASVDVDFREPVIVIDPIAPGTTPETALNIADSTDPLVVTGTSDTQPLTVELRDGDGGLVASVAAVFAPGEDSWSASFDGLDGLAHAATFTVSALATTPAGNPGTLTGPSFVTDFEAPEFGAVTVTDNATGLALETGGFVNIAAADAGLTVAGSVTGAEGQTVTVRLVGGSGGPLEETGTVSGDGSFSVVFAGPVALEDSAAYEVLVDVADAAGNPAETASPATLTAALTAPEVSIDSHADTGLVVGSSTLGEGETVTLTVDGVAYTANTDAMGNWSLDLPRNPGRDFQNGLAYNTQYAVAANVADSAGNTGSAAADVLIYRAAGVTVLEAERDGTTAVYEVYQTEERATEQFRLLHDPEDVQFAPGSAVFRSDFFLTAAVPEVFPPDPGAEDNALRVTALRTSAPPQPISTPALTADFELQAGDQIIEMIAFIENTDDLGGNFQSLTGTAGADVLAVSALDSAVQGRGGDDAIDLSAGGVNTLFFAPTLAENGTDTVTGFALADAGPRPDAIGFLGLDPATLRGAGTDAQALASGAVGADTGFLVVTTTLADFTPAGWRDLLASLDGYAEGDVLYALASDGTDGELVRVTLGPDTAALSDAGIEALARFEGMDDLAGFGRDNLVGFDVAGLPEV
jgi:hypothetical protein